eukprot:TRINITY_DN15244_c0_g1_i1.p1 TRINITY_DN15244_c0_g1~~TRINITY_DN15244_c0_g1_i1.p1  ORF type:complete len:310 (-),score=61.95 TRINITY_DN15244_c0_g1_i1:170-1099(-)
MAEELAAEEEEVTTARAVATEGEAGKPEELVAQLCQRLNEVIEVNGALHEEEMASATKASSLLLQVPVHEDCVAAFPEEGKGTGVGSDTVAGQGNFAASLVYGCGDTVQDNGFELWIGSFEDCLNLEGLRARGINALLNCAMYECQTECACARPTGAGRRRSHARGPSATEYQHMPLRDSGQLSEVLGRDQIQAVAHFDEDWYSNMLGYATAFHGMDACDVEDYNMEQHFSEAIAFLSQCKTEGRKVLVHCIMGVNRSATSLIAFLCGSLQMPLKDAVELVSRRRGYVLSNKSFLEQLVRKFGNVQPNA